MTEQGNSHSPMHLQSHYLSEKREAKKVNNKFTSDCLNVFVPPSDCDRMMQRPLSYHAKTNAGAEQHGMEKGEMEYGCSWCKLDSERDLCTLLFQLHNCNTHVRVVEA